MIRSLLAGIFLTLIGAMGTASTAHAQDLHLTAYGLRSGLVLDNDLIQLLVGGQVDLGTIANNIRLQPLVTVGVGDDAVSLLAAAEAHYLFPVRAGASVEPYAGGGIGVHHIDFDDSDGNTEFALTVVGGADIPVSRYWGWFAEGRFVIADESVFRLEGGLNWRY